jgi:hypothetical protein
MVRFRYVSVNTLRKGDDDDDDDDDDDNNNNNKKESKSKGEVHLGTGHEGPEGE